MTNTFAVPLSVGPLLAEARRMSGIDIIDRDVVEPLKVLLESLNGESCLHEKGALATERKLLRLLCNRLRMQRDFAAHPEIAEQVVKAPIIICGMARTGSTKMQKLLAATGDFNWLPFWQSHNPSLITGDRHESPQQRIAETEEYCAWFDQASPDNKYAHDNQPQEPDEESYLLEQSFKTPVFMGWSDVSGYLKWLFSNDVTAQFRYLLDLLKYLQWQGLQAESKRWVLKCPLYFGVEPVLLSVFPDACLVMTHRHPRDTIASTCRFLEILHEPFTEAPIDYLAFFQGTSAQIHQHLQTRASRNDIRYLDIGFSEIVTSSQQAVSKVYTFCGIEPGEAAMQRIADWDKANPINKKGVHKYALADFGITDAMIEDAFSGYIKLITNL